MKGMRGMGENREEELGGVKIQPRDWRRSAEPEEDVEARLPCYVRLSLRRQ